VIYLFVILLDQLIIEKTGCVNRKNDMIKEIISKIESARINKGISETALAKLIGVDQNKVWRFLNGKTKRPDVDLIDKLQLALGLIAEPASDYSVIAIHIKITPEEEKLLQALRRLPDAREGVEAMLKLSPGKLKIKVGEMLEEIEKG